MSSMTPEESEDTGTTTTSPTEVVPPPIDPWPEPKPIPPADGWDALIARLDQEG